MEAEITSRAIAFIKQNAKATFFAGCLSPMLVPRQQKSMNMNLNNEFKNWLDIGRGGL
jgi:hypothetical protein